MWWIAVARAATLSDAWLAAEQHDPDLVAVDAGVDAAGATVGAARAALLPKLRVAGGYTLTDEGVELDFGAGLPPEVAALLGDPAPIEVQPQSWWQASATVVQPLIDLDGWASVRAAGKARDAAAATADGVRSQVRSGVARAFYGVYLAREGVRIGEAAVAVARGQQEVAEQLVAAGATVPRTALEAKQAELVAQRNLFAAIAAEVGASEALHRLTGLPRDVPIELGYSAVDGSEDPVRLAGSRRAEVRAASATEGAARAARSAATLAWAPDLTATVTGLRTQNDGLADDGWIVQGTVEAVFLFDGGYKAARAREASANLAGATALLQSRRATVEEEVNVVLAERDRAQAALVAAEQEVVAAEAALADAGRAFEQGAATFIEVERAALGARSAGLSVARERVAVELAAVQLTLVTGG